MKFAFTLLSICWFVGSLAAQTLPTSRAVDWTIAGLKSDSMTNILVVDMSQQGLVGDASTPNDVALTNVIANFSGQPLLLQFDAGTYLFNNTINFPNNCILKGKGADSTIFKMDLGGSGHAIDIAGTIHNDTTGLRAVASKDIQVVEVWDTTGFAAGDWLRIIQQDNDLVTSSWAEGTVGQLIQIDSVSEGHLWLASPMRMTYDTARNPYVQKLNPAQNVGIECLKIERIDNTAPAQGCNIQFRYAVNCWVTGIESENCTFAHIKAEYASNLYISKSYLHHGFEYGGGGRAYGVVLQFASGECLVENNVFERLRHAMLLQAGANGNVFAYNYSFDPYWSSTPNDAAGDMVLHGNYVFANLFEQNICRNIVIDNSHGPNGPHNTFLRNRAEGYGIFFSASNSPDQNFLGNDITNTSFPYSFANYTIQGSGHFIHGNNNKGNIVPAGTASLPDLSYAYTVQPSFLSALEFAKVGTPNIPGAASIPAKDAFVAGTFNSLSCQNILTMIETTQQPMFVDVYPQPCRDILNIVSPQPIKCVRVYNEIMQQVFYCSNLGWTESLNLGHLPQGLYFMQIVDEDGRTIIKKVIKN